MRKWVVVVLAAEVAAWANNRSITPPRGWSSWNWKQTCTTNAMLRPQAEALVSTGLAAKGYTVFMADCAGPSRAADNSIALPEEQWPGGIKAWNAYLHSKGLQAGFYTDYGVHGCCACPWQTNSSFGDAGHIEADMLQLASAGTDYIKVDSCQPVAWADGKPDDPGQYGRFRDAIAAAASHHPMTYSIIGFKGNPEAMTAQPAAAGPYGWLNRTGNSWRTSADISYSFTSILSNLDTQESVANVETLSGPGGWADPDMLMFANQRAGLTPWEDASHLALWVVLKAPLLLSTDLTTLTPSQLAMLLNDRLIAVHDDPLGEQARRIRPDPACPGAMGPGGCSVTTAPAVPAYSLPLTMQWDFVPVSTLGTEVDSRGAPNGSVLVRNVGTGGCLRRSSNLNGTVSLAPCSPPDLQLLWVLDSSMGASQQPPAATASGTRVRAAGSASGCLGTVPVPMTAEFGLARTVSCDAPTALWRHGAVYLNMSFGLVVNIADGRALDAAPRDVVNIFGGRLAGMRWAAVLLNRATTNRTITLEFSELGASAQAEYDVTDVWSGKRLARTSGSYTTNPLRPHESEFVLIEAAPVSEANSSPPDMS